MVKLQKNELKSFILLIIASLFDGITQGIFLLQESIAKKALFATDFEISLIGVIANGTMIFSFFISYFFSNRSKKSLIIAGYIICRAIFLFSFLITSSKIFLIFLFFFHLLFSIQVPVFNSFLNNKFKSNRGYIFGITRMVLILITMITSMLCGKILELSSQNYKIVLTIVAFPSLITYLIFLSLELENNYKTAKLNNVKGIIKDFGKIVKNKDFLFFEIGFMTYGFAFMIMVPAVPIYLLRNLNFSYSQMSFVQGILAQIAILIVTPFIGKLYDKISVWKVEIFSFLVLVFYPLFFLISYLFKINFSIYLAFLLYSLGLSGVNVIWNVGSITF